MIRVLSHSADLSNLAVFFRDMGLPVYSSTYYVPAIFCYQACGLNLAVKAEMYRKIDIHKG